MLRFPKIVDGVIWVPQPDGRTLLRHEATGRELGLGPMEFQVLTQLDGATPTSELEQGLALMTGRPIRPGTVRTLAEHLARLGVVELPEPCPVRWLPDDRVRCDASSYCCHLQVGPLDRLDRERLSVLPWQEAGEAAPEGYLVGPDGEPTPVAADPGPTTPSSGEAQEATHPGPLFIRRAPSGACAFLESDRRCQLHRVFGYPVKPTICRVFPLFSVDLGHEVRVGASLRCPGTCTAGPEHPVGPEIEQHGDLLLRTDLQAGPLFLGEVKGARQELEATEAAALEEELLEVFASSGRNADEALAAALEMTLQRFAGRIPAGVEEPRWRATLAQLYQGQLDLAPSSADLASVQGMVRLVQRTDELRATPALRTVALVPESDALFRRNLRLMLFTRYHLFRFGLIPGLALLARFHTLARWRAAELALEQGHATLSPETTWGGLHDAFLGAYGLGEVEAFPGVGERVLRRLVVDLKDLSG